MMHFFRDEGAGGGTGVTEPQNTQTPETPPEAGAEQTPPEGKETQPTTPTIDDITKERDELKGKYDTLATKLGKQSDQVGELNKLLGQMKTDPQGFITSLAKQTGVKLTFAENKPVDLNAAFADGDPTKQSAAVNAAVQQQTEGIMQKFAPQFQLMHDNLMTQRYADWDDGADGRVQLQAAVHTNSMTLDELTHLAWKGVNLAETLEAGKKEAIVEYQADLAKKNAEQLPGGAPGVADVSKDYTFDKFAEDKFNESA